MQVDSSTPEIIEFLQIVENVYGYYLDTISALRRFREFIFSDQAKSSKRFKMTIDEIDSKDFIYGKGHPTKGNWQHVTTQGELKKRLALNGQNEKMTANFCIVLIHHYWEHYREKLENRLGMKKNDIKSDIMGDIRYLRNSILKHNGFGNEDLKKSRIIVWFKKDDEINISDDRFEEIIKIIRVRLLAFS